jgi:uncharacterized protein (DUF1810 family)
VTSDTFDLDRFLKAQESGIYERALSEIRSGRKRTHWMWFIFPQMLGLGQSQTAIFYGITGRAEAEAYLQHPVLGSRLRACAQAVLDSSAQSAHELFGSPDDLKLRSSMSLFASVAEADSVFYRVLDRYFNGEADGRTAALLLGGN